MGCKAPLRVVTNDPQTSSLSFFKMKQTIVVRAVLDLEAQKYINLRQRKRPNGR